jgi:hypothetical protein
MSAVALGTDIDQRPALVRFVMIDAAKGSRGPELQFWNGQLPRGQLLPSASSAPRSGPPTPRSADPQKPWACLAAITPAPRFDGPGWPRMGTLKQPRRVGGLMMHQGIAGGFQPNSIENSRPGLLVGRRRRILEAWQRAIAPHRNG